MFKKRPGNANTPPASNPDQIQPKTIADYLHRGWQYYSLKQYDRAKADFEEALRLDADDLDAYYALGLTNKASGQGEQAVQNFQQVLNHLDKVDDNARASMLSRLAQGHIDDINNGDWNLEKAIWQKRT
jgi:tetratricopeptide (TPR) repeat protein